LQANARAHRAFEPLLRHNTWHRAFCQQVRRPAAASNTWRERSAAQRMVLIIRVTASNPMREAASARIHASPFALIAESRLAVGSSRTMNCGFLLRGAREPQTCTQLTLTAPNHGVRDRSASPAMPSCSAAAATAVFWPSRPAEEVAVSRPSINTTPFHREGEGRHMGCGT